MERITIEYTAYEGENNVYLFAGDETVLIDTGIAKRGAREELEQGLARHGVSFADVDRILLTHYHSDHTGLAGQISRKAALRSTHTLTM